MIRGESFEATDIEIKNLGIGCTITFWLGVARLCFVATLKDVKIIQTVEQIALGQAQELAEGYIKRYPQFKTRYRLVKFDYDDLNNLLVEMVKHHKNVLFGTLYGGNFQQLDRKSSEDIFGCTS